MSNWECRAPSLRSVLGALLAALGETERDQPPDLVIEPTRAAALLLVDGLGENLLRAHAPDAPFLASLPNAGPLAVGFPSSTAVSLASLGTGRPAGAHGIVGTSFRVAGDELIDALKWTSHGSAAPVDLREAHPPEQVQPLPTVLARAAAAGVEVTVASQRAFKGSGLTRATLRGGAFRGVWAMGDLAAEMAAALGGPGKKLCYGYHADLDLLGHLHGPGSLPWRLQLRMIDELARSIHSLLPTDAVLAVTGDHGMIRMDRTFDADTNADLQRDVVLVGGDPRSRHIYARAGSGDDVLATWREVLGDAAWAVSREQAIDDGWFGTVDAAMTARIGDVVVAARGTAGVIRSVAEPFVSTLPGQHGSMSTDEQLVPLLLARRP